MDNVHHPTKEQVRQWLMKRWQSHAPLPDAELIRRQLGWSEHCCAGEQSVQQPSPSDQAVVA